METEYPEKFYEISENELNEFKVEKDKQT